MQLNCNWPDSLEFAQQDALQLQRGFQTVHSFLGLLHNVTVHRAAANDIDFRNRAARGFVCNGLLFRVSDYREQFVFGNLEVI